MKKRYFFGLFFLLISLIFAANLLYEGKMKEKEVSAQSQVSLNKGATPPDFTLTTVDGKDMTLSALKGKKVILNFWATWCPPCKAEMPYMQQYYETFQKEHNVEIVAVNLTSEDNGPSAVQKFIKDYQLTFPVLLDKSGEVADSYKVLSIPTTYFLTSDGHIYEKRIGPMSEEMLSDIVQQMP
ncbi:redoxin domain-containing protein [Bacillus spongiae]|uniref:Redoxin domain-containing protein n=1 Tax=Bacillus spongiae TaxID=2683610 RepID=A0ABU8HE52_9BACI